MTNLEKSELVLARILELLLDRGIQLGLISFDDLELEGEYLPFYGPCFEWLVREGLVAAKNISGSQIGDYAIISPSLTARGLVFLGLEIEGDERGLKILEVVRQASSERKSLSEIGDFTGGFFGGMIKSLGS